MRFYVDFYGEPAIAPSWLRGEFCNEEQSPEYFAYEVVQRGNIDCRRAIWTRGRLGLPADTAETAIENVSMPWRVRNGWRSYVLAKADGHYVLQDKPPVKPKRYLENMLKTLVEVKIP